MSLKGCVRALGALAILGHLIVILLVPNRESYLNQTLLPIINPYINLISMNTAWQFFSPDPGPATYILSRVQKSAETIAEEYMPPEKDPFTFRTFFNRRVAVMRFLGKDPECARQILIPWLCQKYPEATSVHVQKVMVSVPSLDSVKSGVQLNDLSSQIGVDFSSGDCDRGELVE